MKKLFWLLLLGIFLVTVPGMAGSFRCGTHPISVGDHSFVVLQYCGEPMTKEVVGYTSSPVGKWDVKMEHWIYGPKGGYYYILLFKGGILSKITSFRKE